VSYVIQSTDDPPFVTCKTCSGRGYITTHPGGGPDYCAGCGGHGEIALDMSDLVCLAANLRIAAGLCAAFEQGSTYRMRAMVGLPDSGDWYPGCHRPQEGGGE
jgi:hypothetical protein